MRNAFLTNAALQITTIISGVIFFPFYFQFIGSDQYYALTLFVTMQAWFAILDLGLSPAIARISALCMNEGKSLKELIFLIRKSLLIIGIISLIVIIVTFIMRATYPQYEFLKLPSQTYFTAIFILILKWFLNFGKFTLNGLNKQAQINLILITLEFCKHFISVMLMTMEFDALKVYFMSLLVFTLLQAGMVYLILFRTVPIFKLERLSNFTFVKEYYRLVYALGAIGLIGVFTTQTDRSLMLMFLTLEEIGYFAVILMFLNGLNAIQAPLYQTLVPKLTQHSDDKLSQKSLQVYSQFARYTIFITSLIVFFVTVYADQLLYWWTSDSELTAWVTNFIFWFGLIALSNNLSAFAFFLQTAVGVFKYHFYGSIINFLIQALIVVFIGYNYSFELAVKLLSFYRCAWALFWVQFVHTKFKTNLGIYWFIPLFLIVISNFILLDAIDLFLKDKFMFGSCIVLVYLLFVVVVGRKVNKNA